jgi:hypothetical protein
MRGWRLHAPYCMLAGENILLMSAMNVAGWVRQLGRIVRDSLRRGVHRRETLLQTRVVQSLSLCFLASSPRSFACPQSVDPAASGTGRRCHRAHKRAARAVSSQATGAGSAGAAAHGERGRHRRGYDVQGDPTDQDTKEDAKTYSTGVRHRRSGSRSAPDPFALSPHGRDQAGEATTP